MPVFKHEPFPPYLIGASARLGIEYSPLSKSDDHVKHEFRTALDDSLWSELKKVRDWLSRLTKYTGSDHIREEMKKAGRDLGDKVTMIHDYNVEKNIYREFSPELGSFLDSTDYLLTLTPKNACKLFDSM